MPLSGRRETTVLAARVRSRWETPGLGLVKAGFVGWVKVGIEVTSNKVADNLGGG